jgi:hypothetical protein
MLLAIAAAVALLLPIAYRRRRRLCRIGFVLVRRTSLEFLSITLLAICVIVAAFVFADLQTQSVADGFKPVLFAAVLAAIGWLYSTFHAIRNSISAQTSSTLDLHKTNASIESNRQRVLAVYPEGTRVGKDEVLPLQEGTHEINGKPVDPLVYYSIIQILNFFEQVAVGIRHDRLDEIAIETYLAPIMYRSIGKFYHVISYHRRTLNQKKAYDHLHWLMRHWYGIDLDTMVRENFLKEVEKVRDRQIGF